MPDSDIMIYPSAQQLAEVLASEIAALASSAAENETDVNIALCGGTTPKRLYSILSDIYAEDIPWSRVHLFWVDERCVPSSHADSNYGFAREHLLGTIPIPKKNIHFINGDSDPDLEATRYSAEIETYVKSFNGLPRFDLILLGLGLDGHTASIFNEYTELLDSDMICSSAKNPETGQWRVTLTGTVINNAATIVFMVTGVEKSGVVAAILDDHEEAEDYPAAYIYPEDGVLKWYLDEDAAADLR